MQRNFIIFEIFLFFVLCFTAQETITNHETSKSFFPLKPAVKRLRNRICKNNPYKHKISKVKFGISSKKESIFIANKRKKIESFLINNFGSHSNEPQLQKKLYTNIPNVALCLSGGGYRAMIGSIGFLNGLKQAKILDLILYVAALSGSSWGVACWISSKMALKDFYPQIRFNIKTHIKRNQPPIFPPTLKQMTKNLITKYIFEQPIGSVDLYGSMMINEILHHIPNPELLKISHQQQWLEQRNLFLPLYTAVSPYSSNSSINYEWFEFNPYVARNIKYNYYTKIWAFGRRYENGISIPHEGIDDLIFPPELPLSNFLGIFGSAFTLAPKEIFNLLVNGEKNPIKISILKEVVSEELLTHKRIFSAEILNPLYQFFPYSTSIESKRMCLIDAGINFNLPLPPLLQQTKSINLIIIFDMSHDYSDNAPGLRSAEIYAKEQLLPFPDINYKNINKNKISVFKKADSPTIIYIPFSINCLSTFCDTLNFNYTEDQIDYLFNQAKDLAHSCSVEILKNIFEMIS